MQSVLFILFIVSFLALMLLLIYSIAFYFWIFKKYNLENTSFSRSESVLFHLNRLQKEEDLNDELIKKLKTLKIYNKVTSYLFWIGVAFLFGIILVR